MNTANATPRLDLWIREDICDEYNLSQQIANLCIYGVAIVCDGYALNYRNFLLTAPGWGVLVKMKQELRPLEGVYFDEYPPEVQAEMESEQINSQS